MGFTLLLLNLNEEQNSSWDHKVLIVCMYAIIDPIWERVGIITLVIKVEKVTGSLIIYWNLKERRKKDYCKTVYTIKNKIIVIY